MTRVTKPIEERKQEIIETALQLFQEKGYKNTTMQDIAVRMNVAQGLCYRYFKSKQDIFAATSDYYAQNFLEYIHKPLSDNSSVIEKFNLILSRLFEYAIKHEEFEASFMNEPQISATRLDKVINEVVELLIPIVAEGVKEDVFQCSDIPNTVRFLAFGIANTIHHNMPKQNTKKYISSFIELNKTICKNVLQSTDENIGDISLDKAKI